MKSRSVGEPIENFMVTWPNSQERGTHVEELDMGTNREAGIVESLMNLSTSRTLGTAMQFFYVSFLLDFHGSNVFSPGNEHAK